MPWLILTTEFIKPNASIIYVLSFTDSERQGPTAQLGATGHNWAQLRKKFGIQILSVPQPKVPQLKYAAT